MTGMSDAKQLVAEGRIHYFLGGGRMGGATVYDLTAG